MKILEVSRYKKEYAEHMLPFVKEQGEAIRACGCEVDYFLVRGNYVKAVGSLKAKIREFKPDVVHAHYGLSAITAELQSLVPVVTTFHNGETHSWYINFITSLMSLRAKHVIYVAQHIYDMVYFKAKNYSIIPCGVPMDQCVVIDKAEARKQLGWSDDKKYIMFGGAFDNLRKNYPLLKEAVKQLKIGDRTLEIEVVEMKGLSREQCVLRMNACDVFALPTKNEGSPQALKEAMACNCPIVATDVADIKHLLGGLPGHYVLPNKRGNGAWWKGDEHSAEELAELLKQALSFEGRTKGREQIVELGYTNELVSKQIIDIYNQVLDQKNDIKNNKKHQKQFIRQK